MRATERNANRGCGQNSEDDCAFRFELWVKESFHSMSVSGGRLAVQLMTCAKPNDGRSVIPPSLYLSTRWIARVVRRDDRRRRMTTRGGSVGQIGKKSGVVLADHTERCLAVNLASSARRPTSMDFDCMNWRTAATFQFHCCL